MLGSSLKIQSCHRESDSTLQTLNGVDLQVPLQDPGTENPNKDWNSKGQDVYVFSIPLGRKLPLYWAQMVCAPTLANCFPRRKSFQFQIYSLYPLKRSSGLKQGWGECYLEGEVT